MKRLFSTIGGYISAVLLGIGLSLASCNDKDNAPEATFPEARNIECVAGDTPTLSFSASAAWQLSSNAIWCMFDTATGLVQDTSGTAGEHSIVLNISSEGIKDVATTATITMKMADKEATIATVVRGAEQPTLHIYNAEGRAVEVIELGYGEYIEFSVEANFRFAAIDIAECADIEGDAVTGGANERVKSGARIVGNGTRERYAFGEEAGEVISFSNEEGNVRFDIPVVFGGMGDDNIAIYGPTSKNFGWEVSLDGSQYRLLDEDTEEYITYDNALPYTIAAQDDRYEILCFEQINDCGIPYYTTDAGWIHFDKSTGRLSVDSTTRQRSGAVMALPMAIYDTIKDDIKAGIFELDYASGVGIEVFKNDFLKYVVVEFTQCSFEERNPYEGFYVYHSLTIFEIACSIYDNTAIMSEYGVTDAYSCPFPKPIDGKKPGIVIDPRIEGWTTDSFEAGRATAELYYRGERLKLSEGEYAAEENKDERMAIRLVGPTEGFDEEVYVLFKLDGEPRKLLVVTAPKI